jgi:hypothetical protein
MATRGDAAADDINAVDDDIGTTKFSEAIRNNDYGLAEDLLDQGADPTLARLANQRFYDLVKDAILTVDTSRLPLITKMITATTKFSSYGKMWMCKEYYYYEGRTSFITAIVCCASPVADNPVRNQILRLLYALNPASATTQDSTDLFPSEAATARHILSSFLQNTSYEVVHKEFNKHDFLRDDNNLAHTMARAGHPDEAPLIPKKFWHERNQDLKLPVHVAIDAVFGTQETDHLNYKIRADMLKYIAGLGFNTAKILKYIFLKSKHGFWSQHTTAFSTAVSAILQTPGPDIDITVLTKLRLHVGNKQLRIDLLDPVIIDGHLVPLVRNCIDNSVYELPALPNEILRMIGGFYVYYDNISI